MARDDDRIQLPLVPGPVSNGEFLPARASAGDVQLAEAVLTRAATAADRLGIDRRRFLQTTGGMAALLAAVNVAACSGPARRLAVPRPGGSYNVPPPEDLPACEHALSSRGEFIVDVHTHHVMPSLPWRTTAPDTLRLVLDMLPPDCTASNPLTCVDRSAYLHDVFLASDTTVALLSDLPTTGESNDPIPFADAEGTRQLVAGLTRGGAQRLLLQNVLAPNFGPLQARLDEMTQTVETGHVDTFKVYTAWGPGGRGFDLDDPAIGLPVVQHAHDLGVRIMCGHKGLPLLNFESTWNQPRDMVAVSRQFPDMQFVVYHAGWTPNHVEGPLQPGRPGRHRLAAQGPRRLSGTAEQQCLGRPGDLMAHPAHRPDAGRACGGQAAQAASARSECSGAQTASGTDHRRPRSWRFARSRSRPSTRTATATRH